VTRLIVLSNVSTYRWENRKGGARGLNHQQRREAHGGEEVEGEERTTLSGERGDRTWKAGGDDCRGQRYWEEQIECVGAKWEEIRL
jgi:hypothetical protein